jgi:hypothetical protein
MTIQSGWLHSLSDRGTKHLVCSFQAYGFDPSTTVHQSSGHSPRYPHLCLLRRGRMFGIGFDIPSPTVAQSQPRLSRVQTAPGNGDQTSSAAFQAGEPRGARWLACPNGNRTGNNRSLHGAAGAAARCSIHAGTGAAAHHRRFTQAQTTEGAASRDESGDVNAAADTVYSRVRRFGSPDEMVLEGNYFLRCRQPMRRTGLPERIE